MHHVVDEGAALAVATDEDRRVRALADGQVDNLGARCDGLIVGVLGLEVRRQRGGVPILGTYALASDLVFAEVLLETGASRWSGNGALCSLCEQPRPKNIDCRLYHTMLPGSVDPRAMMKVTSLHGPSFSSFEVIPA